MRYRPPKVGVVSTLLDNPQSLADSGIDVWVWAKTTIDKVHDESLLAYYDETEARIPLLEYCE